MLAVLHQTAFSPCRQYRYSLWRQWDVGERYAMFVGLNPSSADEVMDDPTIRRCVGFAKRWRYGAVCVANLFAFRSTKPAVMKAQRWPVGEENDRWLVELAAEAGIVVAAWGVHGTHLGRDRRVMTMLEGRLACLGTTKDGHPRHPLYLRALARPRRFA